MSLWRSEVSLSMSISCKTIADSNFRPGRRPPPHVDGANLIVQYTVTRVEDYYYERIVTSWRSTYESSGHHLLSNHYDDVTQLTCLVFLVLI